MFFAWLAVELEGRPVYSPTSQGWSSSSHLLSESTGHDCLFWIPSMGWGFSQRLGPRVPSGWLSDLDQAASPVGDSAGPVPPSDTALLCNLGQVPCPS